MNLENTHPVRAEDIDRAHRVGKTVPGKQRPLLVKFATYRVRQRVFRAKRSLNPKFRNSENGPWGNSQRGASDVSTPGSTNDGINATRTSSARQIIFINEDLTSTRATLLYHARMTKKSKDINDCWSSDGTILVKSKTNKISPIQTPDDLKRITQTVC